MNSTISHQGGSTPPRVYIVHPGAYLQCTTYLVAGSSAAVVLDPGSGVEEDKVLAAMTATGCPLTAVRAILLTHAHVDHALGAGRMRERLGVPLVASETTAGFLRNGDPEIWKEHPAMLRPTIVDRGLADSERIELPGLSLTCILTPGHTRGCASYLIDTTEGRTAFTGDLLSLDPRRPGWAGSPDFSIEQSIKSLERLCDLGVRKVYTGHGPVEGDARDWLRRGIAHGRRGEWVTNGDSGGPDVPECLMREQRRSSSGAPGISGRRRNSAETGGVDSRIISCQLH